MGWCQEFGVQIQDGCDHAMVAGHDSCSCAECGVVCRGKFPGCATVWAAGPVQVALRRPTKELGLPHVLRDPSPTNGKATSVSSHEISARSATVAPPQLTGDLVALMHSLRSEIQMLNQKIERGHARAEAAEEAVKAASQAAAELPPRIGRALSAALQQQQRAVMDELAGFRKEVVADVGQLADRLTSQSPSPTALQTAVVAQIDARFEWLVNELSDRLVVLGNEVVRINEQLSTPENDGLIQEDRPHRLRTS